MFPNSSIRQLRLQDTCLMVLCICFWYAYLLSSNNRSSMILGHSIFVLLPSQWLGNVVGSLSYMTRCHLLFNYEYGMCSLCFACSMCAYYMTLPLRALTRWSYPFNASMRWQQRVGVIAISATTEACVFVSISVCSQMKVCLSDF